MACLDHNLRHNGQNLLITISTSAYPSLWSSITREWCRRWIGSELWLLGYCGLSSCYLYCQWFWSGDTWYRSLLGEVLAACHGNISFYPHLFHWLSLWILVIFALNVFLTFPFEILVFLITVLRFNLIIEIRSCLVMFLTPWLTILASLLSKTSFTGLVLVLEDEVAAISLHLVFARPSSVIVFRWDQSITDPSGLVWEIINDHILSVNGLVLKIYEWVFVGVLRHQLDLNAKGIDVTHEISIAILFVEWFDVVWLDEPVKVLNEVRCIHHFVYGCFIGDEPFQYGVHCIVHDVKHHF